MPQTFDPDIEALVLACLLKNVGSCEQIRDTVASKSFNWRPYGSIYKVIADLTNNDYLPDKAIIAHELDNRGVLEGLRTPDGAVTGRAVLDWLEDKDADVNRLETYARELQDMYATRQLIALLDKEKAAIESGSAPIDVLSRIDVETGKIAVSVGAQNKNLRSAKDVGSEVYEQFEEARKGRDLYIGTGIDAWDHFTNGLYPGRLYVVAAASNDGKSSLVQNILHNVSVERGVKAMLLSLESSSEEVYNKLIQRMTGISAMRLERASLKADEVDKYTAAVKRLANAPIIFDDSPELILPILRTKIRKAVADGAKLVIIDQLEQILVGGGGDTQAEHIRLNYIAYRIKAYAREMNVPIILVHQMNRAADTGQNRGKNVSPQLQDLAQAGEKPADAVVMIRHKRTEHGEVSATFFYWVKNRQGIKGVVQVEFDGERVLFKDMDGNSEFMPPDLAVQQEFEEPDESIE